MSYRVALSYTTFLTASGECSIAWNAKGIASLLLPTHVPADIERWRMRRVPQARRDTPDHRITAVIDDAIRYFDGKLVDFSDTPVDLTGQNEFFRRIYQALRLVQYGATTTYGALARDLGAGPEMAREVGVAMATNPVPLIIPCHRVLAAGGKSVASPLLAGRIPRSACCAGRCRSWRAKTRQTRVADSRSFRVLIFLIFSD